MFKRRCIEAVGYSLYNLEGIKHNTLPIILIQEYFLCMKEDLNLHIEKTHSIAGKSNLGKTETL